MFVEPTLEKAVQFAIKVEEKGAKFYADLAQKFEGNAELQQLFTTLSEDEESHSRQFQALEEMVVKKNGKTKLDRSQSDYLEAMALSEFFAVSDGPFKGVNDVKNREDALAKVFAFEKATLGYYQAIKEVLGENEVLDSLIDTEKEHVITVAKVMIADSKLRSLSDDW